MKRELKDVGNDLCQMQLFLHATISIFAAIESTTRSYWFCCPFLAHQRAKHDSISGYIDTISMLIMVSWSCRDNAYSVNPNTLMWPTAVAKSGKYFRAGVSVDQRTGHIRRR